MVWWQALLWGVAGAAIWTLVLSTARWLVLAWMDARLEARQQQLAKEATADPAALAARLGLPRDAVQRYADGYTPK